MPKNAPKIIDYIQEYKNILSPKLCEQIIKYYDSIDGLLPRLLRENEQIQCIVCNENVVDFVKLGQSQYPKLWNYADNVDTIEFLLKI